MRLFAVGILLIGLAVPAMAKPAPTAETLRFVAACARDYAWYTSLDRPRVVRAMQKEHNQDYFASRAHVNASKAYLRHLSPRAFRRRLDDALYLTTPRSRTRCAVAYVAAMRGVDTILNCRRMNDAVPDNRPPRQPQEWEVQLLIRVEVGSFIYVNILSVPDRLIDVYRRYPDDRILAVIYAYPAGGDGEGQMTITQALSTLAGEYPEAMLRVAAHDSRSLQGLITFGLCGFDANPKGREQARRIYPRIARAGGPLAAAARKCLQGIAEDDAYQSQRVRRERAEQAARGRNANR